MKEVMDSDNENYHNSGYSSLVFVGHSLYDRVSALSSTLFPAAAAAAAASCSHERSFDKPTVQHLLTTKQQTDKVEDYCSVCVCITATQLLLLTLITHFFFLSSFLLFHSASS